MQKITSLGIINNHKTQTEEEYRDIKGLFVSLKKETENYFASFPAPDKEQSRKLLLHMIDGYIRSHELRYLIYKKENVRDRHLAENALWIREFLGDGPKIAIWAHNAHVANDPEYTQDGKPAMGKYLKDTLGEQYLIVATAFSHGQLVAVTEDYYGKDTKPIIWSVASMPAENSSNFLFAQAEYPHFFFNISELSPGSKTYRYLNSERPLLGVGDFYFREAEKHYAEEDRIFNLIKTFDVMFYFTDTKPINIFDPPDKKK